MEEIQNKIYYAYALFVYYVQLWWYWIMSIISRKGIITFDNGKSVRINKQIAEGGFSVVFEAVEIETTPPKKIKKRMKNNLSYYHNNNNKNNARKKYALKRVLCADDESIQKCREEAAVHSSFNHPNLLPLLGITFEKSKDNNDFEFCYLLFPYLSKSLRDDINERHVLTTTQEDSIKVKPYKDRELLEIFSGCVDAVIAFHEKNLAHRDIKVENIMFHPVSNAPILIDYGSVGPLELQVRTRSDILHISDSSAMNSTVSYRAPELFDGGTPHGKDEPAIDGRTDVWSLGCLLFAMMYGVSPFECEFVKNDNHHHHGSHSDGGTVRVVECSQLRVLGQMPRPIPNSALDRRYNKNFPELLDFVEHMLTQDRLLRPNIDQVVARLDVLLKKVDGTWRWRHNDDDSDSDEVDAFVQFV